MVYDVGNDVERVGITMADDNIRIDFVSIDLDNIADTLDELEYPKQLDKWPKENTWIELGDVCNNRIYRFNVDKRALEGEVAPGSIWFQTHEDMKIDRKANRETVDISSGDVLEKIKRRCIRWVGTNSKTGQDVAGVFEITDWEEEHFRNPDWGYYLTLKGNIRAVQKDYNRHIKGVVKDGFIAVDKVEFVYVESETERCKWEEINPWINLDKYTAGGQYSYTFRIHKSGLSDNCAPVKLHFNWPADFTPNEEVSMPFKDVLNNIKGRYIKWHGKDKLGGSAGGMFCFKDTDDQSAAGVGRVDIILGGLQGQSASISYKYETKDCPDGKGKYSEREFFISNHTSSSNHHNEADAKRDWVRKEGEQLIERLLLRIRINQEYPIEPLVMPPFEIEEIISRSAKSTLEVIDCMSDIHSYKDRITPCDCHNKGDFNERLSCFIKSYLSDYIQQINDWTDKLKERDEKHFPHTFTADMLVEAFKKIKHRMTAYIDKDGFEHIFHNRPEYPYMVIESIGRKQFIQSLPLLQDCVEKMLKAYIILPYGKCKCDWTDEEKKRYRALSGYVRFYRDQAPIGTLVPRNR